MTSQLASSVDFTVPFYRTRVVVATMQRHRGTGGPSTLGRPLTTAVWLGAASTWTEGRPLTTAVWLGAAGVVVVLGLLIGVASCCNDSIDEPQQTSVTELQSRRPGWHLDLRH